MKKLFTSEEEWHEAEVKCAKALAKLYLNGGGNTGEAALKLVISSWSKVIKHLNPRIRQQKFDGKTLDKLSVDEKLKLDFPPPHRTLARFAETVRFAAAVAQKVA